jgi:hypothetical protein
MFGRRALQQLLEQWLRVMLRHAKPGGMLYSEAYLGFSIDVVGKRGGFDCKNQTDFVVGCGYTGSDSFSSFDTQFSTLGVHLSTHTSPT